MNNSRVRVPGLLMLLGFLAAPAYASDIYRCAGDEGLVFSDRPCAENAERIMLNEASSGIIAANRSVVATLNSKRQQRQQQRYLGRLLVERDHHLKRLDQNMVRLTRAKQRANNNLAGATYAAGLDQQIAALHRARADTELAYQQTVTRALAPGY